jgi:hypothetical protein
VEWIHLAQDKDQWLVLVNTVRQLPVPQKKQEIRVCILNAYS